MGNEKELNNLKCKKYHFTYQTKCLINGKTYVGRHSTNNLEDGYLGSGKLLKRAISKYGKESFKLIILSFFETYEELISEEKFIVDKKFCSEKSNYNIVEGGNNPIMYGEDNPSWKDGRSKLKTYRRKGKKHSFKGKNNPRYNYKYSIREKENMILSQKNRKKIIFKGKEYPSIRSCMREVGRSRDYIKARCNFI